MSFDLYVWGSPRPATAQQAERICHELAAGNSRSVSVDARVRGFAQEMLGRFPALESLADEEMEISPWSMTPEVSASHVIMTISWSRAPEVAEFVLGLAARQGLVCFDPQADWRMQYDCWLGTMSDNVLSVIPTDPRWQPEPSHAEQARR